MTPPPDPNPTAPVEEKCATCGREEVWHRGSMHGFRKPAPAPEPKQGSEEPIDLPKWDLPLAEPGISSRLSDESIERLAHLMATETSWDHAKVNSHADELARAYLALRAEVEALKAAVRDGVVLLEAAHRYVLDADAQFFAFEIEQYIRAQKEHAHE